jgi:ribosomal protein L32
MKKKKKKKLSKKKKKKKKLSKKKSTESWRMPKQITSKLHFLLGYAHK